MPVSPSVQTTVEKLVSTAQIKVLGIDLLKNDSEAVLLIAAIRAFGNEHSGFIYISPSRARSTKRPPDIVLCHPNVGLLIIEAKGHPITEIKGIEAGTMLVSYQNRVKPTSIIRQLEDQMYEIESDVLKVVRDRSAMPLINCMVALPNVSEDDWRDRKYNECFPCAQLLFKEQLVDHTRLKKRVDSLVIESLARSGRSVVLSPQHVVAILRVFGNSDVINDNRTVRVEVPEQKLGGVVDEFQMRDSFLSEEQKEMIRLTVDGFPRVVRGVAGSGKTVVLAELVARYLYRKLPAFDNLLLPEADVSIAVTCFNQTLVDFLKRKIQTAYKMQTLVEEVPSSVLLVTHLNQLMWSIIKHRHWPLTYISIDEADADKRARMYRAQIKAFAERNPQAYQALCFDALFVDEGQDFEQEEFRLLLDLVNTHPRTGEKTIVIFYDDAQDLYGRPRPIWKDVGINVVGERSKVMRTCFRNSRQVVELAFNILLGSQAPKTQQVQTRTYADVPYLKQYELIEESDDYFHVRFAERDDLMPIVKEFATHNEEIEWVARELVRLIQEEEVRPEDILILFSSKSVVNWVRLKQLVNAQLPKLQFIQPFLNLEDKNHYIFRPGYLTLSTVHGAKGYDAAIVFVIGTDRFGTDKIGRATFYVAATRAKLLLYITGWEQGKKLLAEAQAIKEKMERLAGNYSK